MNQNKREEIKKVCAMASAAMYQAENCYEHLQRMKREAEKCRRSAKRVKTVAKQRRAKADLRSYQNGIAKWYNTHPDINRDATGSTVVMALFLEILPKQLENHKEIVRRRYSYTPRFGWFRRLWHRIRRFFQTLGNAPIMWTGTENHCEQ